MRIAVIVIAVLLGGFFSYSIWDLKTSRSATAATLGWYQQQTGVLEQRLRTLCTAISAHRSPESLQQAFREARLAYKPMELLTEYYLPYTTRFINGPDLQEVEADEKDVVVEPEGFQVLEGLLFPAPHPEDTAALAREARRLLSSVNRIKEKTLTLTPTDGQLFDAMRQELLRISSLGISGFDSPVAQYSLAEAAAALRGVEMVWRFYADRVAHINPSLKQHTQELLSEAQTALTTIAFNDFDRLHFISNYMNRLSVNLKQAREALQIPYQNLPHFLDPAASHVFAKGAFTPDFYSPNQAQVTSAQQVALGKRLFYDPVLSYNRQRSCATCHNPQRAFTDGLRTPAPLKGEAPVPRNTPTILNAALQPSQFYDQRVAYLEDQVQEVVHNKAEMHGDLAAAASRLKELPAYQQLFRDAFGLAPEQVNSYHLQRAIASYIRSLISLNSPFDAFMRGDTTQMNEAAKRGFNIFMGKAKCGTCHFMPLFNGVAPPEFAKTEAEIIGVPKGKELAVIDDDPGKFNVHHIPLQRYAFKTPTIRNVALTAPYMHNGVFDSLEEVMTFYNNGGGAGMGIHLDNQTLPTDSLHLTKQEEQDVIAFMEALSDTTGISTPVN